MNFTKSIIFAAAAFTLAGAASAEGLKAEIPFAFQVGNKLMQPGTYEVHRVNTNAMTIFRLSNTATGEPALAAPGVAHDAAREWKADGKPRLAFECGTSRCSLSELWDGDASNPAQRFRTPKSHTEAMRTAIVVAAPMRTD